MTMTLVQRISLKFPCRRFHVVSLHCLKTPPMRCHNDVGTTFSGTFSCREITTCQESHYHKDVIQCKIAT